MGKEVRVISEAAMKHKFGLQGIVTRHDPDHGMVMIQSDIACKGSKYIQVAVDHVQETSSFQNSTCGKTLRSLTKNDMQVWLE